MKKIIERVGITALALLFCIGCFLLFGCGGDDDEQGGGDDGNESVTVTITFDLNYEGTESIISTATDDVVSYPSDPERDGYMFTGWYTDADCTTPFEATGLTTDLTVYAGWKIHREGYVYITFMWNYEGAGVYDVEEREPGPDYSLPTVSRTGYMLDGWYTNAECSAKFNSGTIVTDDITLYARWLYGYVFEAECTNLEDEDDELREFRGYSETGQALWADDKASGGVYVGDLYCNEYYIYFEIYCDKAVEDAAMYLNVAMLYGWEIMSGTVEFTSDDLTVTVNGDKISYTSFSFDVSALGQGDYTSFREVYLGRVSLNEGWNTIRLEVSNSEHGQGGTMLAKAPLIDYLKIYTDANLTWDPIDNSKYM